MDYHMKPIDFSDPLAVATYRRLRRAIGYLGISLPLLLVLGSAIPYLQTPLQPSISHYYFTPLRDLFTGILCATGFFLIRYQGRPGPLPLYQDEGKITNMAGALAFVIAWIPAKPLANSPFVPTLLPLSAQTAGNVHLAAAGLFFLLLALLCFAVFTQGQAHPPNQPNISFNENHVYRICGGTILLSLLGIWVLSGSERFPYVTLELEALALFAFGLSWLVKGRFLGRSKQWNKVLYRE